MQDLLERCRTRSASVFETAWEAKAIAVTGCISDTDVSMFNKIALIHQFRMEHLIFMEVHENMFI